jgi:hypothetical protein
MAMAYCGQFVDFGKGSTHKVGKLGQTIRATYVYAAWFCQCLGGIFSCNGQGVSKNPRSCVPIPPTLTSHKNCGQQFEFCSNFWLHLAIQAKDLFE